MPIKIECKWLKTNEGFCVACFAVSNDRGELLMYDEDLYYSRGKFFDHIVKTFVKNKRFKWEKCRFKEEKKRVYALWKGFEEMKIIIDDDNNDLM